MAVFNTFTFDGENSLDYGVYITGEAVYNAPERAVEMVSIPGKNGALALDQGRFENIEVTYPAGTFGAEQAEFAGRMRAMRNMLASRYNYVRLTDSYHPDEYRLGLYKSGLEASPVAMSSAGEFDITFNCKPQRFLTSGEEPEDFVPEQSPADEQTVTGSIVSFEAEEDTIISDLKADIVPVQDLHGYDKPWAGGNGKNVLDPSKRTSYSSGYGQRWYESEGFTLKANQAYTFSVTYANPIALYIKDKTTGDNLVTGNTVITYTPTADTLVYFQAYRGEDISSVATFQLELGSTATSYAPYSNICPISGWDEVKVTRTGKNLIDTSDITDYSNWSADIAPSGDMPSDVGNRIYSLPALKSGAQYTISFGVTADSFPTYLYFGYYKDGSTTRIAYVTTASVENQSVTFTAIEGVTYCLRMGSTLLEDTFNAQIAKLSYIQIELGSTATDYEPYDGETYTTALGQTIYGGTLDVTTGVLTVDRVLYTYTGNEMVADRSGQYIPVKLGNAGIYQTTPAPCTDFAEVLVNSNGWSYVNTTMTKDELKTYLTNNTVSIVAYPATPQTIQLTPTEVQTLLGTNNIWADSGDITAKYGTNPYLIINPTDFASKPLLEVTGVGTFWLGDTLFTITGTAGQTIYIDCETGECYKENGGIISSGNGLVTLNRLDFPELASGINNIQLGSGISKVKITPRWWRL